MLLTAQGLLMCLDAPGVHRLIERCAARFPGAGLLFDAVPRWLATAAQRAPESDAGGYRPPPWTIDRAEVRRIAALPGVAGLGTVPLPRGRGFVHGVLLPFATRLPVVYAPHC